MVRPSKRRSDLLFFEIWNVLYIKTLSTLLRNVDEVTEHSIVIKRIIRKLKEAKQFINFVLVPQMHERVQYWESFILAKGSISVQGKRF